MKKIELLCPVGNMETLYQAIHNGADAVYLAGKMFGARKNAANFSNDELVLAIKYCHLYGVKVYVTVNTMIYESEEEMLFSYLEFLYTNKVDAVIMQDIGIIKKSLELFPNLEIHASTQCHNHNREGIQLLKDMGVTRVVMAREMSLDEINSIDVDVEKEVFVYGALCVCYSGCCLFSSMNGGRSGNRGECVGSCRLPYKLVENDKILDLDTKYLLSTRDLNTLSNLIKLLSSNIDSLKIEGRMKSPYYVGYVTRIYRELIDKYYNNEEVVLSEIELNNLKKLFNREFTKGYLFNDKNIMNTKSPNHIGVPIGKVIKTSDDYIYIKLDDEIDQEDGIRFKNSDRGMIVNRLYDSKYLLTNRVSRGSIAIIDNKFKVDDNDIVLKTISNRLIKDIDNYEKKRIGVNYKVRAIVGEKLEITMSDNTNSYTVYGSIVDRAINRATSKGDIEEKLFKLGNTPFIANEMDIYISDNIFISLKELNNLRRELVDKLIELRENPKRDIIINKDRGEIINNYKSNNIKINVLVRNEEQLQCCIDNNINNIYVTDYELYKKYNKVYNNIFYRTSRVNNCLNNYKDEKLLICELGGIYKYNKDNYIVSDYYLNVANHNSIQLFNKYNVKLVTLSVELEDYEIGNIMSKGRYDVELIIYGRIELMVMKYCPLKQLINNCSICKNNTNKYYLMNGDNNKYPIIHDNCITHIMHNTNIDKIDNIGNYKDMGINNYRIELFDESYEEVCNIIKRIV